VLGDWGGLTAAGNPARDVVLVEPIDAFQIPARTAQHTLLHSV
jgi:hypothetical protein